MKCFHVVVWSVALLGCGTVDKSGDIDAASPDAPIPPEVADAAVPDAVVDASIDGAPPPPPSAGLSPAAGRIAGGPWQLDIETGLTFEPPPATGGTWTLRSGSPIHP